MRILSATVTLFVIHLGTTPAIAATALDSRRTQSAVEANSTTRRTTNVQQAPHAKERRLEIPNDEKLRMLIAAAKAQLEPRIEESRTRVAESASGEQVSAGKLSSPKTQATKSPAARRAPPPRPRSKENQLLAALPRNTTSPAPLLKDNSPSPPTPPEPPRAPSHVQTKSQFVEQQHAGLIRDALAVFYHECGFYPDTLDKLFQTTEQQPSCLHGTKQAPLANTPQNRDTIERLTYMPFGYDDFEISLRLFWTRE